MYYISNARSYWEVTYSFAKSERTHNTCKLLLLGFKQPQAIPK